MASFDLKCTTYYYKPSERQQQAGVQVLEVTQHPNGIIRFRIETRDSCHSACGNSVSDAKKGMWKRLQQILPQEARADGKAGNAFERKEGETEDHSAGILVEEREKKQKVEHELDKMTERKEHHKKLKRLYRAEAEKSTKEIKELRKENQELRKKNAELLTYRLFGTDDEDEEDVPPIAKKPKSST